VSSVEGKGGEMEGGMGGVGGQLDGLGGQQASKDSKESSEKERSSSKDGESQEERKNKQHPLDEQTRRLATLEKQQRGWRDERNSGDVQHRRARSMRHKVNFTLMIVHDQRLIFNACSSQCTMLLSINGVWEHAPTQDNSDCRELRLEGK